MGYFPNGTEGEIFQETWCTHCVHSDVSPGKEIGVDPPCPIWMAHLLFNYELCNSNEAGKEILDMLIERGTVKASDGIDIPTNTCSMFHPIVKGAIPGQLRLA